MRPLHPHPVGHDAGEAARAVRIFQSFSQGKSKTDDRYGFMSHWINPRMGHKQGELGQLADLFRQRPDYWIIINANARFSPEFDSLRGDPRFECLLRDDMPKCAKPFDSPSPK